MNILICEDHKLIVEEARAFYAETMKAVREGGTPADPAYLEGFIFEVPQEDLSNPDVSLL